MLSVQWHAQNTVIRVTQQFKGQNLQGDPTSNTTLWLRDVDALQETGEETRWDLYSPSEESIVSLLEEPSLSLTQIYDKLPLVSSLIKYSRVHIAGHCFRTDAEVLSSLLIWMPSYGQSRGRKLLFPGVITRVSGLSTEDLRQLCGIGMFVVILYSPWLRPRSPDVVVVVIWYIKRPKLMTLI